MKKILIAIIACLFTTPALAYPGGLGNPHWLITAPDTVTGTIVGAFCEDFNFVTDTATGVTYRTTDCATTPVYTQVWPVPLAGLSLGGTSSQYLRGDGALATLPVGGSKTFNYPSRALNSCFQISSTKDAGFHYKVDVTGSLSLTSGTTGTVTATTYTNSGCSTGAQVIADGASAQSGSLVVGLGITQTASIGLDGLLPAGKWLKITTANTVGTPTFAIRGAQSEVIQP